MLENGFYKNLYTIYLIVFMFSIKIKNTKTPSFKKCMLELYVTYFGINIRITI